MKAIPVLLSFLLFFVCTHSFFCSAAEEPNAVLDIYGKMLRSDTRYYILPVIHRSGGGLTTSSFGSETCPLSVAQEPYDADLSLPLTFTPVNRKKGVIRVSTDLNIKISASRICSQSNVWNLDYSETTGEYTILTDGVEGNPGPLTLNNWFKIENLYGRYYKFVYCPTVCTNCEVICKDVGIFIKDGTRGLTLTDDQPLRIMFKEA